MNFRVSIKQILARIHVALKKKDLKVIVCFKKELIPFLVILRQEGIIYKFTIQQKTIVLCLKKGKGITVPQQKQKVVRDFDISSVLYKNPTALIFFSATVGVCTKRYSKGRQKKLGGTQLFLTY
jgi:ribosomal protein S8